MFASFLLSLREGVEAALIIGIVLAALHKIGRTELRSVVWQGVLSAVGVSILAGLAFSWLGSEFEGRAEEIFEGTAMLIAVVLLTWMIVWMKHQSNNLQSKLEDDVQDTFSRRRSHFALFGLAFLAVGREGFELVLFLAAIRMTVGGLQTWLGAVSGLVSAIILGWILFTSSRRMSLNRFFTVTNLLLVLFAAGLFAHGVHEFNEAGLIPAIIEHLWDINPILDETKPLGQILAALFGYNGNPSLTEVLAYGVYILFFLISWGKLANPAAAGAMPHKTNSKKE